jgi:hypothetical protein
VAVVTTLVVLGVVPALTLVAFIAMLAESVYGDLLKPKVGVKPAAIGMRQVVVALVFALLMIAAYRL